METHSRRTLLRYAGLTALALAAAPALAACGAQEATSPPAAELVRSQVGRRAPAAADLPAGVAAVDALATGLYRAAIATGTNAAYSPLSVALALAMTANGAAGRTQAQMLSVLGGASMATVDRGMNALVPHLAGLAGGGSTSSGAGGRDRGPTLQIADALFGQSGLTWRKPFLDTLAADYGAGLRTVDFAHATETARATINQWTSDQTAGKIPQILPPGSVTAMTALVLVNAIHLKARWAEEFQPPTPGPFQLADGSGATVPTMRGGIATAYAAGPGWQAASLPYVHDGFAMTLIIPTRIGDLPAVESQVAAHGFVQMLGQLRTAPVAVQMPTFTVRTGLSLARALSALGMPLAFTEAADFSPMTADAALSISDVLHQAVVAVDEHGTEAAAATAVSMTTSGVMVPPRTLVVDRPFLFVIHDIAARTPLFVGKVADPRA